MLQGPVVNRRRGSLPGPFLRPADAASLMGCIPGAPRARLGHAAGLGLAKIAAWMAALGWTLNAICWRRGCWCWSRRLRSGKRCGMAATNLAARLVSLLDRIGQVNARLAELCGPAALT